ADDDGLHYACNVCALPAPVKKKHASDGEATAGVVEVAETLQEKPGLLAMLDYEHVASTDVLGSGDSLSMQATYGMEGKYFNPRVQRSEHFLEPWSMSIEMRDPRGSKALRGEMKAERHMVLNITTGLSMLVGTILETRQHHKKR
ncbi:unnamed protein product, partial [Sphacelaria rigidula]